MSHLLVYSELGYFLGFLNLYKVINKIIFVKRKEKSTRSLLFMSSSFKNILRKSRYSRGNALSIFMISYKSYHNLIISAKIKLLWLAVCLLWLTARLLLLSNIWIYHQIYCFYDLITENLFKNKLRYFELGFCSNFQYFIR